MRRGVWLLVLAVVAAALGVGSARADGTATTTTTTATTTTTTTTAYAPLAPSSLPATCVGAGAAALVFSPQSVTVLGTPASSLGPSAYGSAVAFGSSTASGSTCNTAGVALSSVSLFGGAVTATSIQAVHGSGTVAGLEIDGAAVAASAGETLSVGDWGQLTLGTTVGRVTAPLVLRLLQDHDGLSAGTAVAVAFGASGNPVAKPKPKSKATGSSQPGSHSAGAQGSRPLPGQQPAKNPPAFPASPAPFLLAGRLPPAARHNSVVSIAMKYLGVPYLWGGASPKTGFDCSGLVQYVFAQLGVYLPHYAASQYYSPDAIYVSPKRLQPGDLVFFTGADGTHKAPGHVGIYVDDGYIIDAPNTGSFVRIDSLSERWFADEFVGARRIVGASDRVLQAAHVDARVSGFPVGFRPAFEPAGESLGVAAADTVAVQASLGSWTWVAAVLGVLLVLFFTTGPRGRDQSLFS